MVAQLLMVVGECEPELAGFSSDGCLLLTFAALRFLDVCKIGVDRPGELAVDGPLRVIDDRRADSTGHAGATIFAA